MATSKKKLSKRAVRAPVKRVAGPIEVELVVTKFNDVLAGCANGAAGTGYVMKLRRATTRARIVGNDLFVRKPGGLILFSIASMPGDAERYYAAGVTFVREGVPSGSDAERLGLINFPQARTRPDGRSVFIFDSYRDPLKRIRFKFSVVIQRGSDGAVGIIDPGIEHDGDN